MLAPVMFRLHYAQGVFQKVSYPGSKASNEDPAPLRLQMSMSDIDHLGTSGLAACLRPLARIMKNKRQRPPAN